MTVTPLFPAGTPILAGKKPILGPRRLGPGDVIEVASPDALRTRFEELVCDKHLSPAQIAGIWESNEPARKAIEQFFGKAALAQMEAQLRSAQGVRNPPTHNDHPEPATLAAAAASSERLGHDRPLEPERGLGL